MAKSYRGSAAKKPDKKSFGGGNKNWEVRGYRLYEETKNKEGEPSQKKISDFKCEKGERNRRVIILDKTFDFAVYLHKGFKHDGTWANMVVCRKGLDDDRGCPLCKVLEKNASWHLCGTIIDQDGFTPTEGKNKGVKYENLRRLLLIPEQVSETFETIGEDIDGGQRGAHFKVTRSEDDKSLRIGNDWRYDYKTGKMSEQGMLDEFEDSAARHGLSVESFAQPIDYDTVLKPVSYERMLEIANDVARGLGMEVSRPASLATAGTDDDEEEALPF